MNKSFLLGNVGKEPEIKESQSGMKIARFSFAVKRSYKKDGETDTDWLNIIAFDKKASFVEQYVKKGTKLVIIGHISTGSYTAKDGSKRNTFDIVADEMEFAESKTSESKPKKEEPQDDGFVSVEDDIEDSLPFN